MESKKSTLEFNPEEYLKSQSLEAPRPEPSAKPRPIGVATLAESVAKMRRAREGHADPEREDPAGEGDTTVKPENTDINNEGNNQPIFMVNATIKESKETIYFKQRTRVTFELDNGIYSMPAIAVVDGIYGLMIILPAGNNDTTFGPKPGASLNVLANGNKYKCYSPGTIFNVEELDIMVIVLVKETSDD